MNEDQLAYAERVRAKLGIERPLLDLLREIFSIPDAQLRDGLDRQRERLKLGELLVELGYLREEFLELALSIQREDPRGQRLRIGEVLLDHHLIDESKLAEALAIHLGFPLEVPGLAPLDPSLVAAVSLEACERHGILPLRRQDTRVVVAFSDPTDPDAITAARDAFGENGVAPVIAERGAIRAALARSVGRHAPVSPATASPPTVVDLLDELLDEAIGAGACAVHLEPRADGIAVRMREDGVLATRRTLPLSLAPALMHHLRVLCRGDGGDGTMHFVHRADERTCEVRMTSCTIPHGERVVLRLLDVAATPASLDAIGASPLLLGQLRTELLSRPSGLLLIAGPPGGGRSATLHACLAALAGPNTAIAVAQGARARPLEGAAQFVRGRDGGDFAQVWLCALEQDPDVLALDEIESPDSAHAAVAAASAGRRVLATCAAEDAVGAVLRLLAFGVDRALLAASLGGVLAQQLLRRVCGECAQADASRAARAVETMLSEPSGRFLAGTGCTGCRSTGFRGRAGVFEYLSLATEERRGWIVDAHIADGLRAAAAAGGVVTLFEDGVARAARGHVSIVEASRRLPHSLEARSLAEILSRTGR